MGGKKYEHIHAYPITIRPLSKEDGGGPLNLYLIVSDGTFNKVKLGPKACNLAMDDKLIKRFSKTDRSRIIFAAGFHKKVARMQRSGIRELRFLSPVFSLNLRFPVSDGGVYFQIVNFHQRFRVFGNSKSFFFVNFSRFFRCSKRPRF